ncbi:MAG: murein biosynthesis integral membrane protein MurJ [Deltaproteobacteria bacterium]|nr:murein biosynthesis integral membrane protein MurJ [Deltaproteobacteria bacterium]
MTPPKRAKKASTESHSESTTESHTLYGHAGVVTFYTLLSRILGLARDLVISHRFGASGASDAWVQAFRVPNALRRLTAEGSMSVAFVPVYVNLRETEGRQAALDFARRALGMVLFVTLLLTGLGMVFSDGLTWLVSPGFAQDPERFDLTSRLIWWNFPYLALVSLVAWAMGVLNSEKRFAAPAAAPIFLNLGIIAAVVWFSWAFTPPIVAVGAGVLAGGVAQVLLQIPSLRAAGVPLTPLGGWNHPHMKKLYALLVPSLFGVAVYQINIILLGMIASYLPTGQIFYYNNATRLTEFVLGLFAFAFTTAGLPALSAHQSRQDWEKVSGTLRLTFSAVLFVVLPATLGLMAAGEPVVSMLYLHGQYTLDDTRRTATTMAAMALGMPAVALVRAMVPAFYTLGNPRTPVVLSALSVGVTGALGWQLSQTWQVEGLALGLSLGTWFQCLALGLSLKYQARHLSGWFPWRAVLLQSGAAVAASALAWQLASLGRWDQGGLLLTNWLLLVLVIGSAAGVYLTITLLSGEPEAANWMKLLGRVGRKLKLKG